MSLLSICIPTYNRKERLIAQLESLSSQNGIESVPVIISDNGSDYSVENEVLPLFSGRLDLRRERFNVNTSVVVNISSYFLYGQTEWVWILGDDDETLPGAVEKIVEDIKNVHSRIVMIKYSLDNAGFHPNEDEEVESFEEFAGHYKKAVSTHPECCSLIAGDCAFCSTCVIRRSMLDDIAYTAFFYGYNQLAFMVPVLFSFGKGFAIRFSSHKIVRYISPEVGGHWSVLSFMLGLCTWRDMPLSASEKDKKWFVRFMSAMIPIKLIMSECLHSYGENPDYARYVLGKIMRECYQLSFFGRLRQWIRYYKREMRLRRRRSC